MATSDNKGIEIKVVKGNLVHYKADVIVNSVGNDLNLTIGLLSKNLTQKAGDEMKTEIKQKYPKGIKKGEVAVSKGYKLDCQAVYHVSLCRFTARRRHNDHTPEQVLFATVQLCLQLANKSGYKTIAFPTLGLGIHGFSHDIAAEGLSEAVRDFEHHQKSTSVTEVHVVVFEKDNDADSIVSAYQTEATREVQKSGAIPVKSMYKKGRPLIFVVRPKLSLKDIPPRGSKDFIKYIFKKPIKTPSYWTKFPNNTTIDNYLAQSSLEMCAIVDVEKTIQDAISKLVEATWNKDHVGHGVDAKGLTHSNIKVTAVQRIENILQYYAYATNRQQVCRKVVSSGSVLNPIHKMDGGGQSQVLTEKCLDSSNLLRRDLLYEVNECYLFHGTEPEVTNAISTSGLDSRLSSEDCMHGKGVYFAESSTKADQYADRPLSRSQNGKTMILARVCLGESYISDPWIKFVRAPCKQCFTDDCLEHKHSFDSVVTKEGVKLFREFVVYLPQQAYPEYIVHYNRI